MEKEIQKRITQYGEEVDLYALKKDYDKLKKLLEEMEAYGKTDEIIRDNVRLNYFLGTGYSIYSDHLIRAGKVDGELQAISLRRWAMFYFRKGIDLYDSSVHTDPIVQLRMLTNYANALNTAGRCVEALRIYRKVLLIDNQFYIALGNYGRTLKNLANMVNDGGHRRELHCYAYQAIKKAIMDDNPEMHEQAKASFRKIIMEYESLPVYDFIAQPIVNKEIYLGEGEELEYRKWCLSNHLFLNPMNEVIDIESAFAHDPLTVSSISTDIMESDAVSGSPIEPPRWFAMLNQLKEEYIYARYLYFSGIRKCKDIHYADKCVKLSLGSLDYTQYSVRIEQIKSSFRILFSMLDKIGFFVNDYWNIGLNEKKADAFHICKASNYPKDNSALVALYWVFCEFFETYGNAETAYEKDISILRNAMEHKFVKVHESNWKRELKLESDSFYHITEDKLRKYTIRLIQIAREAIIYLVYAIGIDENRKEDSERAVMMQVLDFPDIQKR